jgi:23S rRNA pseudouridine2605 synthase
LTAEQLEASRSERMRQNGHGALTLEDARTWIEETGLCLFLPRRQFSSSIAPSFVEAIAGKRDSTPEQKHIALAEELLVRLEIDGVAVRLNLLGQPGEQPDFVVASWVLPYVYALRGDRDWRRSPQLTGSRQVSQLAIQAYKLLEAGDTTIASLKHALGREVTETAVLRAITELWQQLRIIPVVSAPGQPAQWQLLKTRYQKAIAEGASTSQVTAISVLASIYLQAVIAASMEEVELFLAPLTARSKVREVLRGLVATRQVHTISLGHAPHFYVAGTLPEFAAPPSLYTSSSTPASAYFMRTQEHGEDAFEFEAPKAATIYAAKPPVPAVLPVAAKPPLLTTSPILAKSPVSAESLNAHKSASNGSSAAAKPHFSRPATHARDRKPAQASNGGRSNTRTGAHSSARPGARPIRRTGSAEARPTGTRPAARPTDAAWKPKAAASTNGKRNGTQAGNGSTNGVGTNGSHGTNGSNGSANHRKSGAAGARTTKSAGAAWGQRNGHGNGIKSATKPGAKGRSLLRGASATRSGSAPRKDARPDARPVRNNRKPALAAGTKAGNSKRYGFTARPKQETKKRG